MKINKIKWFFVDAKKATKAIEALGADSLAIFFYINNKKIKNLTLNCKIFTNFEADKQAKKHIRKFFKQNQGINDFVEFIKY